MPDSRLGLMLRAADLVVLPYRAIQNSGSAILALSADRPVVVPALGAMTELADQVGLDWVHTYDGEFSTDVLIESLHWLRHRTGGDSPDLSGLDWNHIGRLTVAAYHPILAMPRPRSARPEPITEPSVLEGTLR